MQNMERKYKMKDFLEGLKKTAYVGSKILVDKTKQVVDVTKKEVDIQRIRYDINKQFRQIGILTYKHQVGEISDPEEKVTLLVNEIKDNYQLLDTLNNKQEDEKEEDIMSDMESADDVDEKEPIVLPEKNDEGYFVMRFCNYCNVGNHPDANECVNCGRKLK